MKKILLMITLLSFVFTNATLAMKGMDHGVESKDGIFKHTSMADGIHTEFQVMELANMNMKDPDGKTHHVMAAFKRDGQQITEAVGKVKLISPSGKEQLANLEDFGNGIFAANFTIDEPGKWGVICLFKEDNEKHTVKFWYSHMDM